MAVSESDDDDSNDASLAPSHQEREIHAINGDFDDDSRSNFDTGDNFGMDEHDTLNMSVQDI